MEERLRKLETPFLLGVNTRWRAQIEAVLGDSADAVRLPRQAVEEGQPYPPLHREPDLEELETYPPFTELMRPRS